VEKREEVVEKQEVLIIRKLYTMEHEKTKYKREGKRVGRG